MYLVISSSLNPRSRSFALSQEVYHLLEKAERDVELLDLRDWQLPLCDGGSCYGDESVGRLGKQIRQAKGVIIATPIYNYDVSAAMKNVVELTGKDAWSDTVVGFVCAAGGGVSYMALMGLANSLMLDFHTFILPRFVFATGKSFDDQNQLVDHDIRARVEQLASSLIRVTEALVE